MTFKELTNLIDVWKAQYSLQVKLWHRYGNWDDITTWQMIIEINLSYWHI